MYTSIMVDLLSAGFFPKEMPDCFVSRGLAGAIADLTIPPRGKIVVESAFVTLPQANGSRRTLTVPNPKGHVLLVKRLSDHWSDVDAILKESNISKSRPVVDANGCVKVETPDLPDERLRTRRRGRYLLRLDISDFYNSVYTHALPWAIHGRAVAKANKNKTLFGNLLDNAVRSVSSNETRGIPVGPITSLVLAELLLSPIDRFVTNLKPVGALRFFDDFELAFDSQSDATAALEKIEVKLYEYRLSVNPLKTRIDELPAPIENSWLRRLRQFRFKKNLSRGISPSSLDDFFDNAIEISRLEVGDRVLPYAIGRIQREIRGATSAWKRIEKFLLHLLFSVPEVTPNIVSVFVEAKRRGNSIDKAAFQAALNHIGKLRANSSPSLEVVWSLWGLAAFRLKLAKATTEAIKSSNHSVAKLLVRYIENLGMSSSKSAIVAESNPWASHEWLLAHESLRRGYQRNFSHDDFFTEIRNIEFLTEISEVLETNHISKPVFQGHNQGSARDDEETEVDFDRCAEDELTSQ